MADTLTLAQRRRCMAAIRGKDTKPELAVRSIAHRLGFRFRLHGADLPGKPDLVFRSRRAVVFVHGCYWHSHTCKRGRSTPATNAPFWKAKRLRTRERDRVAIARLRRSGWRVLVIWECQLTRARLPGLTEKLLRHLQGDGPLPRPGSSNTASRRVRTGSPRSRRVRP